jgi:hypothetical protein
MERFVSRNSSDPDKSLVNPVLEALFKQKVNGWDSLVIAGAGGASESISPSLSRSESHGGFDNDEATMNSVLFRILGAAPMRPFTVRDLRFE